MSTRKLNPSSVKDYIDWCILHYPTLFLFNTRGMSRTAVMTHAFLTLGNGLGWTPDGWLADVDTAEAVDFDFDEGGWKVLVPAKSFPKRDRNPSPGSATRFDAYPYIKYLSPYGKVRYIPQVIKRDWLLEFICIVGWARDCYNMPEFMDHHMKAKPDEAEEIRKDMIQHYNKVLKQLDTMWNG